MSEVIVSPHKRAKSPTCHFEENRHKGAVKMYSMRKWLISASLALLVSVPTVPAVFSIPASASEIRYIINDVPVTSYDIQRRAAFLRLQRRSGDLNSLAAEQMIEQTLRTAEIKRLNIRITDQAVDDAYARFAKSNKMTTPQLDGIMAQSGVTKTHFKDFIRTQMGWSQALSARNRAEQGSSQRNAVRDMLKKGGEKPSATEYMLQQVIFVVPKAERGATLGKRKREAEALRGRFSGCDSTRQFAKGLIDVTVRDLGRVLAPELPPEWADQIKSTKPGGATSVRETDRGVEFIGICSAREVSDDRVAQLMLRSEAGSDGDKAAEELDKKYMAELRERARIVKR